MYLVSYTVPPSFSSGKLTEVPGGCGSFYAILISSPAFNGFSTIKQHKMVNECLKEDIKTIHGLQVCTAGCIRKGAHN